MSDRTMAQRAQNDEDHRLALCGLSFDAREDEELEDFKQRHYDFQFFASGHPQAQPPQTRSGGRRGRSSVTPEYMPAATPLTTA